MKPSVMLPLHQLYRRAVTGLDFPASPVGQTTHVSVLSANALGAAGVPLAQRVLQGVELDYQRLQGLFNGLLTPGMTLVVAPLSAAHDGSGGAYHHACSDTVFYCDADLAAAGEATTLALFVAEAVDVFEAFQGLGWDCGASNGEGLSRVLAEALHSKVLDGYETASVWLDGSRTDWVDQTNPTDRSADSNGCAVLFLNWLQMVKGYTWAQIAQAGAPTLAGTYRKLSSQTTAWAEFSADINARWPAGVPSWVTTDNPWAGSPSPPPPPPPPRPILTIDVPVAIPPGHYNLVPGS
jgi:hypothetical protein